MFKQIYSFPDINECSRNEHNCPPHHICTNTEGAYICTEDFYGGQGDYFRCQPGFTYNTQSKACEGRYRSPLKHDNAKNGLIVTFNNKHILRFELGKILSRNNKGWFLGKLYSTSNEQIGKNREKL